ncbi:uncharacterized protein [Montipora capricornis]|uniref:uncharacterized protein isoform X2 n=1 Tax=Montipora capricornis TaxID=246305 RepID=UPI0035F1D3A2
MIILHLSVTIYFTFATLSTITALGCLSCNQPRDPFCPTFQVDLKRNIAYGRDANIAWVDRLRVLSGLCTNQGKLRLTFDKPGLGRKRTARIDLWFARQVTGYSFDIADSPTVNGWGGDAGTTVKGAEVHGYNKDLLMFTNDFIGHQDYTTDNHLRVETKSKVISDHITFYISHERVEVTNYRGYQGVYDSRFLFVLNGQPVGSPPDAKTDIWLSMNRVIGGAYRSGTGLCKVAISWVI